MLRLFKGAAGLLEEKAACLCQGHHPVGPAEELDTQRVLQGLDLDAQGRLRDVNPLRSPAKMQFLRGRDEVPELAQIH